MVTVLDRYLDSIRYNLRLDPSSEREVTSELETCIDDRLQELRQSGLSEEEAANACVKLLGSAKLVARQIYEAHRQGTWKQALLASTPHLLFGLLFALNWWHGKPAWLYGYYAANSGGKSVMQKVVVVTDSIACLTKEMVVQYGIRIVPLNFYSEG